MGEPEAGDTQQPQEARKGVTGRGDSPSQGQEPLRDVVILGAECGFQVCLSGRVEATGWATRLYWLLLWWWLSPWACQRRPTVVGLPCPPSPSPLRGPQFFSL